MVIVRAIEFPVIKERAQSSDKDRFNVQERFWTEPGKMGCMSILGGKKGWSIPSLKKKSVKAKSLHSAFGILSWK